MKENYAAVKVSYMYVAALCSHKRNVEQMNCTMGITGQVQYLHITPLQDVQGKVQEHRYGKQQAYGRMNLPGTLFAHLPQPMETVVKKWTPQRHNIVAVAEEVAPLEFSNLLKANVSHKKRPF